MEHACSWIHSRLSASTLQTQLQGFSKHVLLELGEKKLRTQGTASELQLSMGVVEPTPESLLLEIRKSLQGPIQISREAMNDTGQKFLAQQFLILSPSVSAWHKIQKKFIYVIDWEPCTPSGMHSNPMASVWKKTNQFGSTARQTQKPAKPGCFPSSPWKLGWKS